MEVQEMEDAFDSLRAAIKATKNEEVVPAVVALQQRVAELEPLAEDGRQYRANLITDALAEGVRAFGNDFKKDTYESMLKSAPIATIISMKEDWGRVAKQTLPSGRHSADTDTTTAKKEVVMRPDAAYQV